jgi:uncharacterized protein with von Willebrand factor type A (vWA) domain
MRDGTASFTCFKADDSLAVEPRATLFVRRTRVALLLERLATVLADARRPGVAVFAAATVGVDLALASTVIVARTALALGVLDTLVAQVDRGFDNAFASRFALADGG